MMEHPDSELSIGLYLRGVKLKPDSVSRVVSVTPSRIQEFGKRRFSKSGKSVTPDIGLWAIQLDRVEDLNVDIARLVSPFKDLNLKSLREIAGVEEVYLDIFVANDARADGGGSCNLQLSYETLDILQRLGADVHLTLAVVRD